MKKVFKYISLILFIVSIITVIICIYWRVWTRQNPNPTLENTVITAIITAAISGIAYVNLAGLKK